MRNSILTAETYASLASLMVLLPTAAGMYWLMTNGPLWLAIVVAAGGLFASKLVGRAVISAFQ